jgi:hypothetical protein
MNRDALDISACSFLSVEIIAWNSDEEHVHEKIVDVNFLVAALDGIFIIFVEFLYNMRVCNLIGYKLVLFKTIVIIIIIFWLLEHLHSIST